MIICKTGKIFEGKTEDKQTSYLEMDVSVFDFPFLSKKTLAMLNDRDFFPKMRLHMGFVIQGEGDDELPEVICGCMQLNALPVNAELHELPKPSKSP